MGHSPWTLVQVSVDYFFNVLNKKGTLFRILWTQKMAVASNRDGLISCFKESPVILKYMKMIGTNYLN